MSGVEPEVNRRRPGVGREMTGRLSECGRMYTGVYRQWSDEYPPFTFLALKEHWNKDETEAKQKSNKKLIFHRGPFGTRMIGKSNGVEEEWQQKLLKADVELPHRQREFEPEDERHPESGRLSRKRLTCARVRVSDSANTEGMNEGGREPEVQRKSQKKAKMKVTIADERTSPIARPEVVGEIVAELFRLRNLLHICSTIEPERTEVTERRAGSTETNTEGGNATTCVFATRSILANRKIWARGYAGRKAGVMKPVMNGEGKESGTEIASPNVIRDICRESAGQCRRVESTPDLRERSYWRRDRKWMVIFPSMNVGARRPGSSSDNRGCGKCEGKPDGMPEQLPEEGTEDAGKDVKGSGGKDSGSGGRYFAVQSNSWNTGTETVTGIVTDIVRAPETSGMAGVQGYAGNVKSEKDRPGSESEVDFTRRKFARTISVIVRCVRHRKPEPERTEGLGKTEVEVQKRMEVKDKSRSGRKLRTIEVREETRRDGNEVMEWPEDSQRSSEGSGP
ncbi:hypothetical protein K438DRAFT_1783257 [Mycena galopus ATCC 62051]|nr:hypothetical protein K438DRAFT_1783257 [Mycena galopus ATCC 62051]